jgi:hypothetical protein
MAGNDGVQPLFPGFYGRCTPNMEALDYGGMGHQVEGTPVVRSPSTMALREWAAGSMGLQFCGGGAWLGGWFITRSVEVGWHKPKAMQTIKYEHGVVKKKKNHVEVFFYRAGCAEEGGEFDFFRGKAPFNCHRYMTDLRRQVAACVSTASPHVRSGDAAFAWVGNCLHKELRFVSEDFLRLTRSHGIDLRKYMFRCLGELVVMQFQSCVSMFPDICPIKKGKTPSKKAVKKSVKKGEKRFK